VIRVGWHWLAAPPRPFPDVLWSWFGRIATLNHNRIVAVRTYEFFRLEPWTRPELAFNSDVVEGDHDCLACRGSETELDRSGLHENLGLIRGISGTEMDGFLGKAASFGDTAVGDFIRG
jgi:hypothetical protein